MANEDYPQLNVPERYRTLPNFLAGAYSADFLKLAIALSDVWIVDSLGGGGGGGGDASASNQTTQIGIETSIRNRLSGSDSDVIFTKLNELLTELQGKTEPANTQTISGTVDVTNDNSDPFYTVRSRVLFTETQLTAPGTTVSRQLIGYYNLAYSINVANINTSVTLRFEGSMNNSDWFNLSIGNSDYTITANGTYSVEKTNCSCEYVRANFVSESGGTSATIDIITRLS